MPVSNEKNRCSWGSVLELAVHRVKRLPVGADLRIEIHPAWRFVRDAGHEFDVSCDTFVEVCPINSRKCVLVTARRNEIQCSIATHGWHTFECSRVHALNFATVLKVQIINPFREVKIRVYFGIGEVVEQQITAIAGEEGLHRIAGVTSDGDPLGVLELAVLRCRGGVLRMTKRAKTDDDDHDQREQSRRLAYPFLLGAGPALSAAKA